MNTNLHRVIGIDLGTTYSAVAAYNTYLEQTQIIPNPESGDHPETTPSIVSYLIPSGSLLVGRPAKQYLPQNPLGTVIEIKREMGEFFSEATLDQYQARGRFRPQTPNDPGDPVKVDLNGRWFTPQEISALVLMKMKAVAEQEMGGTIHDAVITVPAYFKAQQRSATEEAARLAGLYPRQIIPEPTAAAICYGVDRYEPTRKVYLVYDLGGGTFDVSIISVEESNISVIATSGDPRLGGGDFDNLITEWAVQQLQQQYGIGVSSDFAAKMQIKLQAEQVKIALSSHDDTVMVLADLNQQDPPQLKLTRPEFEKMIDDLLTNSLRFVEMALNMAEVQHAVRKQDISAILLVGGSSKIPRVRRRLLDYFEKEEDFLRKDIDPDAVVARGAAIVAQRFAPSPVFDIEVKGDSGLLLPNAAAQDVQIALITEHSLGVGIQDNLVKRIVEQGTNIPLSITEDGFTNPTPSTHINVPVYQGEGDFAYQNTLIGELTLGPMTPQPPGTHQFEVTFTLSRDGLLSMVVRHLNEGRQYQATFEQKTGIKEPDLIPVRENLLKVWTQGVGHIEGISTRQNATFVIPTAPPIPVTPPPPAPISVELMEATVPVPDQFKQTVRMAKKLLQQNPHPKLLEVYNAFITRLNSGASETDLEDLGDDLASIHFAVQSKSI